MCISASMRGGWKQYITAVNSILLLENGDGNNFNSPVNTYADECHFRTMAERLDEDKKQVLNK